MPEATRHCLDDYRPPEWTVETVALHVALYDDCAEVNAELSLRRLADVDVPLRLDGEALELLAIALDDAPLAPARYRQDEQGLTVFDVPARARLSTRVRIQPHTNTRLEGLYVSGGDFFTQCEAEGFRRITFYPDRPDVLARFTTTVEAEAQRYPVLLANGNPVASGPCPDAPARHWVRWEDPFPKPSYLFALVAGALTCVSGTHTTASGRQIDLRVYVREGDAARCDHALASLQRAMAWDEAVYGRECDVGTYMIVAVHDFNMGAMENKGLNLFNAQYVLASPETATDEDYHGIESVVAHEYFHNWTGNRITCRDWFQLSLKEGLTVFRDQCFSADQHSPGVERIRQVQRLRALQFPEDASPMAHPVQPQSYLEINNFYTVTVYEKGAEVVRMLHRLTGPAWRAGMDRYFERHDGQAVTIDEFLNAHAEASGRSLAQFRRWYTQAGTPQLAIEREVDAARGTLTLHYRQYTPPTPGQADKQPVPIPLALRLWGPDGQPVPVRLAGEEAGETGERVLELAAAADRIVLQEVPAGTVPSLLRGCSAPVRLQEDLTAAERLRLIAVDDDPYVRWDCTQRMFAGAIDAALARPGEPALAPAARAALTALVAEDSLDPALLACLFTPPTFDELADRGEGVAPLALAEAREALRAELGAALAPRWWRRLEAPADGAGVRALQGVALWLLAAVPAERAGVLAYCQASLARTGNMTERLSALTRLAELGGAPAEQALDAFYAAHREEPLLVNKWLRVQSGAGAAGLAAARRLLSHPAYDPLQPNRVRALLGGLAANPLAFHAADGAGYALLGEQIAQIAPHNPQLAARLCTPLTRWRRYGPPQGGQMRAELERLAAASLPIDVQEVVGLALAAD
ncbi:MAG: aminopeptidase N [Pseudomonadota bacterium]|nr:aminopeptidase N [Pseudomonadota bacterium]